MLGSSLVGYSNGLAGPFWFAAGCSPMIVFFSVLGISCKRKIPEAHTLLEIIRIRYGNTGKFFRTDIHKLFSYSHLSQSAQGLDVSMPCQ
jgi:Na+/proline symporter